jgi:hypothetical protein
VKAAAGLNLGKVGNVEFNLGPDRVFRFTALERLADVAPEAAVRMLAHVAAGVHVTAAAEAGEVFEAVYRRAS